MTALFTYADGSTLDMRYLDSHVLIENEKSSFVRLDVYQAAQLIEELERFIAKRATNWVGDLTWRIQSGDLYVNDVPLINLSQGKAHVASLSTVSLLLTRGATDYMFAGQPLYVSDLQIEHWILQRLVTLASECEF